MGYSYVRIWLQLCSVNCVDDTGQSLDKNVDLFLLKQISFWNGSTPIFLLMTATNKEASSCIHCDEGWANWKEMNSPSDYDRISYRTLPVVCWL